MNKAKYLLTILLITLSFYFTDKIMIFINSKNPIMKEIFEEKDNYYVKPVNATIKENNIIPGIKGKKVNETKSFNKMNSFGYFNDIYFVFDEIDPYISIDDNKDKIIIRGNKEKRMVSFIINNNNDIEDYLNSINIKYTKVINKQEELLKNKEYINGEHKNNDFSNLNSILNKNKLNKKICLIEISNFDECIKNKYYLVDYSLDASKNIIELLNSINSGEIIYINSSIKIDKIKLIINEIKRQDLTIVYLSELIME